MIRNIALLGARLAVGGGIAAHGAQKAFGAFGGPGPAGTAKIMHRIGFRPGETYGPLAAWNEILAGGLIALGLGGPIGPSLLISEMTVAAVSVKLKNGFFEMNDGIEAPFIYSAAALALAGSDFGTLSMDAALGTRGSLRHPAFTAFCLAGGVAAAIYFLNSRDQSPDGPATPTFRGKNSPLPEEQTAAS